MKLSVIIIAKNAEELIADAIDSVRFADEVIVVDNGSSDRTVEIAKTFGTKVFKHTVTDFSELRNLGLEKAFGEWILYVDSDERVSTTLREEIIKAINSSSNQYKAFQIKRKNFYLGNYEWPYIEKLERLFKRNALKKWQGRLHESPIFEGPVGQLNNYLLHYTHRSLEDMLKKTIEWSKIEAELRLKANHPKMTWWRFFRVMTSAFFVSYIKQGGWKARIVGLIESIYQSFSSFITYAKLWEMQNKLKTKNEKNT